MSTVRELNDLRFGQHESPDPFNTDRTTAIASKLAQILRDPGTFRTMYMRWARPIAEGKIPTGEVAEVLDAIIARRSAISSPGRYFGASMKRLAQKHEVVL